MNLSKTQVFSLYLVNENQEVYFIQDGIGHKSKLKFSYMHQHTWLFDNCQLILKPVSEITDKDFKEFAKLLSCNYNGKRMLRDLIKGNAILMDLTSSNTIMTFFITHGYALSDKYFTNGWAVKERDVK